jgi:predicted nicotinamide N-methyase
LLHSYSQTLLFPAVQKDFHLANRTLSLLVPEPEAIQRAYSNNKDAFSTGFPFWSKVWPAALGLCQFIDQHPELIMNKQVLELGAGLGLPSLLAGCYSCQVTCTDYDPLAVAWASQSSHMNGLQHIQHSIADWNNLPPNLNADTLLLSDTNYDPNAFPVLTSVLRRYLDRNTTILLSTPQRLLAKTFIDQWLPFCKIADSSMVNHNGQEVAVSTFLLSGKKDDSL